MSRDKGWAVLLGTVLAVVGGLLMAPTATATATGGVERVVPASTGETLRQCSSDRTLSFKTCLTMNYSSGTIDGRPVVKLKNYRLKIRRTDPSQLVQMTKLHVRLGVHSTCVSQCRGLESLYESDVINREFTAPKIGHVYKFRPPWAGRWWIVFDEATFVCGNAKVTIERYSSTWSDQLPNVCQGSPSLPLP